MHALAPARMWAYAVVCGVLGVLLNADCGAPWASRFPAHPRSRWEIGRRRHRRITALRGLLPIAALLIVWQLTTSDDLAVVSTAGRMARRPVARMHTDGVLAPAVLHTLGTYAFGLACAVVIGGAVGTAIGFSPD